MNQKLLIALSLSLGALSGFAQWNPSVKQNNPVVLASKKGAAQVTAPVGVSDQNGGMYIGWIENRNPMTGNDIFLIHLLASGVPDPKFPDEGMSVCNALGSQSNLNMIEDGVGGVVLTWSDSRNSAATSGDIYAQRVTAAGSIAWPENGAVVSSTSANETSPSIARTSTTQIAITWRFFANSLDLAMNYINLSDGSKSLTSDVIIVNQSNNQSNQQIIGDGNEGCIIVWTDGRNGNSQSGIYAQRFNKTGDPQWTSTGVAIRAAAGSNTTAPQLVNDGAEGAVIAWSDSRNGATNADIYVQRVDRNGDPLWTAEGVQATSATGQQLLPAIVKSNNNYVVSWNDGQNGATNIDLYAQAFSATGTALWNGGSPLAVNTEPGNQPVLNNAPVLVADENGGSFIIWDDRRNGAGDDDIYSQYVNASGILEWPGAGNPICTVSGSNQASPVAIAGLNGSIVVAWRDSRSSVTYGELYASNVQKIGVLPLQFLQVAAQVQNKSVNIRWTTANSFNVDVFEVEKSLTGQSFRTIGKVDATNITTARNYTFTDPERAEGTLYFRIKAVDKDGSIQLSNIVKASIETINPDQLSIYPNPVANSLRVQTTNLPNGTYHIRIFDLSGKNRLNTRFIQSQNQQGILSIPVEGFNQGIYKLQITDEKGKVISTQNIMKQ